MSPRTGALMPERGFSRRNFPSGAIVQPGQTLYVSHDGLHVISSLENADLPGSGDPPQQGPSWLITVSKPGPERCNVTDDDLRRVIDAFAMPAYDEDNHHPGIARHLWCPLDERYQQACECKLTEVTITEANGYQWTTDTDGECRGCEYQRMFGKPCTIHGGAS